MIWKKRIGWVFLVLPVGFVLIAGIGKLLDLPQFARSIDSLGLLPAWSTRSVAFLIAWVELSLALSWLLGIARRRSGVAIFAMISGFGFLYLVLYLANQRPTCNCLGLLAKYLVVRSDAIAVVIRNGVLLAFMLLGAWMLRSLQDCPASAQGAGKGEATQAMSVQRAFTILELVLVMVIVSMLLLLTTPFLRSVRQSARETQSAVNARAHAQVLTMYTDDNRGSWPWFVRPKSTYTVLRSEGISVPVSYFQSFQFWNFAVGPGYYGSAFHPSFFSPLYKRNITTHYDFPCAFIATPEYWNPTTRSGMEQLGSTRISDVQFPSAKVLLIDRTGAAEKHLNGPWPEPNAIVDAGPERRCATVDGAVRRLRRDAFVLGYSKGDGDYHGPRHSGDTNEGMHTVDGVRGRDISR